jgi:hypothetical protein
MILLLSALGAFPISGLGTPYTPARLVSAPVRKGCYIRYDLATNDPIAPIAAFYRREAVQARVSLLNDTTRFTDYRMMTFVTQPKFMSVLMDRQDGRTKVRVTYKVSGSPACS